MFYKYFMMNIIIMILVFLLILISVAFLTLFERKCLSYVHYRKGPNKISLMGLLQPFSDAMKLISKEFFYPLKSNLLIYLISPMLMFLLIMSCWIIYPFYTNSLNMYFNSLFFFCLMSMSVYSLMISGWSSNSSYALLGSIRSIAQSISYEVTLTLSILTPLMMINSLNLYNFPLFNKFLLMIFLFWPIMLILMISMLTEMNRTPFDLSEGESELISGFNIEYSSSGFVLIFLSEYTSILFMMFLFSWLNFCSNFSNFFFYLMSIFLTYFVIWMRATFPRIRYDYLMYFCWFYMLPYILLLLMIYILFLKLPLNLLIF